MKKSKVKWSHDGKLRLVGVLFLPFIVIVGELLDLMITNDSTIYISSFGGEPSILPLSVHAQCNEIGKANPPSVTDEITLHSQTTLDEIDAEPISEEDIIDIDEVLKYYNDQKMLTAGNKTKKWLLNKKEVKWIRFPNMLNTMFDIRKGKVFYYMKKHRKDGVDISTQRVVDTGLLDQCGNPVYLPEYFWLELQAAAKAAKVTWMKQCIAGGIGGQAAKKLYGRKRACIKWGVRDYKLQAIMFNRSVKKKCGKYPDELPADHECVKKVRKGIAGKPRKKGFTHLPSADVPGWESMAKELKAHDFAFSCSGVGFDDQHHITWGMNAETTSLTCEGKKFFKNLF